MAKGTLPPTPSTSSRIENVVGPSNNSSTLNDNTYESVREPCQYDLASVVRHNNDKADTYDFGYMMSNEDLEDVESNDVQQEQLSDPQTIHVYGKHIIRIKGGSVNRASDLLANRKYFDSPIRESTATEPNENIKSCNKPDGDNTADCKGPKHILGNVNDKAMSGNDMKCKYVNISCWTNDTPLVGVIGSMAPFPKDRFVETSPPLLTTGQIEGEGEAEDGPCDSLEIRHTYFSAKDLFGNDELHEMGNEYVAPIDMSASSGYSLASENVSLPDKEQKVNVDDSGYLILAETNF